MSDDVLAHVVFYLLTFKCLWVHWSHW